jgi:uncharacterized membrane protein
VPFWGWLLVDFTILLIGGIWWLVLGVRVARAAKETFTLIEPSISAAENLNAMIAETSRR